MIDIDLHHYITGERVGTVYLPAIPDVEDEIVIGNPIFTADELRIDDVAERLEFYVYVVADMPARWYASEHEGERSASVVLTVHTLAEFEAMKP